MGENEILEKMILLEEYGANPNKIENLFDNYQNPILNELGYSTFLNKIIEEIIDYNLNNKEVDEYIDNSMQNWVNYIGDIKIFDFKLLKPRNKFGDLERKSILKRSKISKKKISEIFKGYDDYNLSIYGYKDLVNNTIDHISNNNLIGKEAIKYIDKKFSEWGENELYEGVILE